MRVYQSELQGMNLIAMDMAEAMEVAQVRDGSEGPSGSRTAVWLARGSPPRMHGPPLASERPKPGRAPSSLLLRGMVSLVPASLQARIAAGAPCPALST